VSAVRPVGVVLSRLVRGAVVFAERRLAVAVVFAIALAVWWLEALVIPLGPGRDLGTYLGGYIQLFQAHPIDLGYVLGRTPLATLPVGGLLDLAFGPQVLHVPDMAGRYYSVQFTDPSDGTNFAYVGTRTTGTEAGDSLMSGPGWKGTVSQGRTQIASPNKSVLVIGRVFVESDSDLPIAYGLAKQIQLTPLSH